jgi:hypothetical protein
MLSEQIERIICSAILITLGFRMVQLQDANEAFRRLEEIREAAKIAGLNPIL